MAPGYSPEWLEATREHRQDQIPADRIDLGFRIATSPRAVRLLAVVATPLALLGVHLSIFSATYWSIPLLVLFLVPGALYGACFGIPRGDRLRSRP